ncbi:UDP-2,4-diacetamido-2,4,6-trideoxy-beta-L-altropyranose hydrolase [Hydrogenothermus marinus]|uniref:UDP-2,4-diacetamido-2,4, 6-trideoxy-beta-L-altropyranose hydrolase n=1 Tax=Hydrogenothermus marinus TaxID=133270 RepID=A0A3M0BAR9_9AQUI|nr:UDP-2,4-diacetamido-2,4,6-trideoxy-beta-L-altropyranose hydrolase [Hydrogenothermus marinus]RMA93269.1 UDP-2,4-diacetamido-2,4,6-trideoxy-beta-L-altropyranose hydrolase [Hydrogenothermus marinus]
MKIYILTEGGKEIGFGHITRCISIYQAFETKKIKPKLILNADETVKDIVKNTNYEIFNWLENKDIFKILKDSDIVLIDSYLADKDFYEKVSNIVKLSVYIDDNKRIDYPKGIVINGNIHATDLDYPIKKDIKYLLGTKYTPLRKEFWEVPEKIINEKIKNVLITFGGDDLRNMTPKILNLLNKEYPDINKYVVIGKGFKQTDWIKDIKDKNIFFIYDASAKEMKELMLKVDLTISAGGQTLYELARVGVPTIAVAVADNQLKSVKKWEEIGFLAYAGFYDNKNLLENILNLIKKLENKKIRENMSKIGRKYVNGNGSRNIVYELITI